MPEEVCGFSRKDSGRIVAAVKRIEQTYQSAPVRGKQLPTGRVIWMARATLTATLSAGGSATATLTDVPDADPITVYDDMLESGQSIASGKPIRVGWDSLWMHEVDDVEEVGCYFLGWVKCSNITG